tara:strand:- start:428 stop:1507 length:1080 start_codon:yes stop_codon:yes gene_type:complete
MQIINKILRLKKVYIFINSIVLFIIIFSTSLLYANNFKVSDIEISSSFDLNFNKNTVIDDGFRESFFNLISMITTSGDTNKIKNIQLKTLKGMIDSFTISNEKFVNNEYFAKLETTFNKKKIFSFLEKRDIFPSIPVKNKILLIPVLIDVELDKIYLFTNNIFYKKWNADKKNYHLLEYVLPSEDIEDLKNIQEASSTIENYDFTKIIEKYDLDDFIVSLIFKNKDEFKVLSKINLKNSLKLNNQAFKEIDLRNEKDFEKILKILKNIYENSWKKNNEINTSIKLPLTILINSKEYKKIYELEKTLNNLDLISNFYILKFDNQNTYYKITYNGSPKTFFNDVNKGNLDLVIKNNIWMIK